MARSRYNVVPQGQINIVRPKRGIDMFFETLSEYADPNYQLRKQQLADDNRRSNALLKLSQDKEERAKEQFDINNARQAELMTLEKNRSTLANNKFIESKNQAKFLQDSKLIDTFLEDSMQGYAPEVLDGLIEKNNFSPNASKMFRLKNARINKNYKAKENNATFLSDFAKNNFDLDIPPSLVMSGEEDLNSVIKAGTTIKGQSLSEVNKIRLQQNYKRLNALDKGIMDMGGFTTPEQEAQRNNIILNINKILPEDSQEEVFSYEPEPEKEDNDLISRLNKLNIFGGTVTAAPDKPTTSKEISSEINFNNLPALSTNPNTVAGDSITGTEPQIQDTIESLDSSAFNDIFGDDTSNVAQDTTSNRPEDAPADIPNWMFDPITEPLDSTETPFRAPEIKLSKLDENQAYSSGVSPQAVANPSSNLDATEIEPNQKPSPIDDLLDTQKTDFQNNPTIQQAKKDSPIDFELPIGKFNTEVENLYNSLEKINKQLRSGRGNKEDLTNQQKQNYLDLLSLLSNLPDAENLSTNDKNKIRLLKQFPKKKKFKSLEQMKKYFSTKYNIR